MCVFSLSNKLTYIGGLHYVLQYDCLHTGTFNLQSVNKKSFVLLECLLIALDVCYA